MLAKVHKLREVPRWDYEEAATICGKRGFKVTNMSSEYENAVGERFEIAIHGERVTCKRCAHRIEQIRAK